MPYKCVIGLFCEAVCKCSVFTTHSRECESMSVKQCEAAQPQPVRGEIVGLNDLCSST